MDLQTHIKDLYKLCLPITLAQRCHDSSDNGFLEQETYASESAMALSCRHWIAQAGGWPPDEVLRCWGHQDELRRLSSTNVPVGLWTQRLNACVDAHSSLWRSEPNMSNLSVCPPWSEFWSCRRARSWFIRSTSLPSNLNGLLALALNGLKGTQEFKWMF